MRPYDHGGDIYGGGVRLDFSVNVNPLGMPPAAREALAGGIGEDVRYPDPYCRALRGALAQRYAVPAEAILCGGGASDLLFRLCACLRPRRVLQAAPTFSEYGRCAALFGAEVRSYPLRRENGFAGESGFLAALTPGTDMVFLCSPNNPTGRLWDGALLREIALQCGENGTYLVLDECFLPFTEGESLVPLLAECPHLLILRAFTKIFGMAGLRLGVLLGEPALLERIAAWGPEWAVSTAAQRAGLAALQEQGWEERTRALAARERSAVGQALQSMGVTVYPSDANFLLCRAPRPVAEGMAARGVPVRRCGNFPGLDERDFRVGLKTAEEDRIFLDTLQEVLHG